MGVRKNVLFNDYKKEHHSVTVYRSGVFEVNTTPLISTPCQDHDILFEIKTHLILYLKVLPLVSLSLFGNSHLDKGSPCLQWCHKQIRAQRNLDLTSYNSGTGREEPKSKTSTEMRDNIEEAF